MRTTHIPLPYGLTEDKLQLDAASWRADATIDRNMMFLVDHVSWDDPELVRILTAAVVLYHHLCAPGTWDTKLFGQCLDTAIIWERG